MDNKGRTFDEILNFLKESALSLSEILQEEILALKEIDKGKRKIPLRDLVRAEKLLVENLQILTDLAPFFEIKAKIEPIELVKEWILSSHKYTGDNRALIMEAMCAYQEEMANSLEESHQYTLI